MKVREGGTPSPVRQRRALPGFRRSALLARDELRTAAAEDADFLRQGYASTRSDELALTDWSDERKVQFCRMQFDAQDRYYREQYPGAEFCVIERDGEVGDLGVYLLMEWRAVN